MLSLPRIITAVDGGRSSIISQSLFLRYVLGPNRYELTPESRAHINFQKQQQFGSLWKLLSELPDEPGVIPDEHKDPRWED